MLAGRVWRDNCLATALGQPVAQSARIVGAVRQQAAWGRDALQKHRHTCQVMRLARRQAQRDGPPDVDRKSVV